MRHPSDYRYDASDPFGNTTGRRYPHTGSDYFAPSGSPVFAIANGVINHVGETSYNGKTVMQSIDGFGLNAAYLHLSNNSVVGDGQRVSEGQIIGYSGNTGSNSLGPHLHITISDGAAYDGLGNKVDPWAFVESNGGSAGGSGALAVDGDFGPATTRALQRALGVTPDGDFGPISTRALQAFLGITQDGDWGPQTTRALQAFLGVVVDGDFGPASTRALQERLNAGTFVHAPAPAPTPEVVAPPQPAPEVAPAPEPIPAPVTPAPPAESVGGINNKIPAVKDKPMSKKIDAISRSEWKTIQSNVSAIPATGEDDLSQYDLVSVGFWNYAGERVIKTFAMTFASMLSTTGAVVVTAPSTANVFAEIGWWYILSVSGVSALTSLLVALSSFRNIVSISAKKGK